VGFGLTLSASRNRAPQQATALAQLAAAHADNGVVAFGLAGDETAHPPEVFATAFQIARSAGLIAAPHAGELPNAPSLRATLHALKPDRIAHGIRAIDEPQLLNRLAEEQVTLDISLTSNQSLGAVNDIADHPLPRLLNAGVRCTLSSDNPLLLNTSLLAEYQLARAQFALSDSHLADLARASIHASGAPLPVRQRALTGIESWLGIHQSSADGALLTRQL
jgi:adenosine deaminase